MDKKILQAIQEMPKVILHIHLDGSVRQKTIHSWILEKGEKITLKEVTEKLMVNKNCRDLNQYLDKFSLPLSLLQTEEHIKQAMYELFSDLANQNVIYAEVRFAPTLHTKQNLTYTQIVEAAIQGMNKAKHEIHINGNLILCCMRGKNNEEENLRTIEIAKKYLGNGIAAIDLAGAEALFPTKDFEYIFKHAKKLNIPYTIHAGEADGINSINSAIEFGASRIGHGVKCLESQEIVKKLIQKNISLEVCPTSNLQTKATNEPHPIEKLYKNGLNITINTDNDTVSNTNILKEYKYILENTDLKIQDILNMNINAANAAFTSKAEKNKLLESLSSYRL